MPPTAQAGESMHPALLDTLADVRRKARTLSVLFGVGVVLASAVGAVLLLSLLDYLLNLPRIPRVLFLIAGMGAVGYVVWQYVAKPLMSRMSLGDVAGRLENYFPQFEDRLRSTVDFVRSDVPGSEVMKRRVVNQAERDAAAVQLDKILAYKPVGVSLAAGIGALVLMLAIGIAFPNAFGIAANRLLGGSAKWPRSQEIQLVGNLPEKVAAGQRFNLQMKLAKGDKASVKATVFVKYDNGATQKQIMTRSDDGTYSVALDARGSKMSLWVEAGDDRTDPRPIQVVERLAITRVEAIVTPPKYSKLDATTMNLSEAPASVVFNSSVKLRVSFNKPLAPNKPIRIEPVRPDAKLPEVLWHPESPSVALGQFTATESIRFRILATDQDSFGNTGLEEYEIGVRPDQNPSVIIETPRRNLDCLPGALVRLEALAEDDFAIDTMTLVVERVGENVKAAPTTQPVAGAAAPATQPVAWRGAEIPLAGWVQVDSTGDRRRFRVKHDWELRDLKYTNGAPFDLKAGDVLEYHVRVTDNFEYNGARHEPVASGKLKINIISPETMVHQVHDAMRAAAEKAKTLKNRQDTTKQETKNLAESNEKKTEVDAADRTALNRINDQQSTITSQTTQLAGQVSEVEKRMEENRLDAGELKDIVKGVKETLSEAAERPMSEASKELSKASDKADPKSSMDPKTGKQDPQKAQENSQQRNAAMSQAQKEQQNASDQLNKALEKMNNLGTFEQMIQAVRDILKAQQELSKATQDAGKETIGKKPEELTAEQKKKLEEIAKAQKNLAEKTDKLTEQLNKSSQQQEKSDPASSQAMKQAAQQAQQQQVSKNQQQASQSAQQNQQAQAQSRQKQAELGLQMMLDTLREAERRKLEQLAKELAKLQELLANLVRRQAGHNIDNLRIQNVEPALKQVTDDLLAKAERVRDKQPAVPGVGDLGNFQITTERNTRDVSKTAEEMPKGGSEIAALLNEAARMMERAVITIKEAKLPEAYDPSQVKALAMLEDAKAKTDKALQEVQEQQENQNRETIRAMYEKIKAEQVVINKETARIDKSPKLPDGSLKREDAVALGKLPGQQGQLAETTKKLEEDLSALGGVVYVWANKDIVDSMNEVKKDLAKPTTAEPTQAEEQRIVDQLDAMIRNLATKPKQSPFNQDGGGGGGGGGQPPKPRLPSEAELRLLKELQIAVNKSTKKIDELPEPKKDKPKLVALGNRQGELRGLLDTLIQKASKGQVKLEGEPDPKDRLPEEAEVGEIEDQELLEQLRNDKPADDKLADDVKLVGQRMARSRQRLALDHDPGKTTQKIQDRILINLDHLIDMARQQQAQAQSRPGQQQGEGQQQQRPGQQQQPAGQQQVGRDPGTQSQPNQGTQGAQTEQGGGTQNNTASGRDIREGASEWGGITQRVRDAIIEGKNDTVIQKYKNLTDRYYEAVGKKGSEQR